MKSYMYIRSCLWAIGFFSLAGSVPWIDPSLEALDELKDAERYKAVVNSMDEWKRKHDLKKNTNRTKREDSSVCYPELGCFEASGPFGYLDMLPSKPEEINTKFLLYPAKNRRRRSGSAHAEVPFEKINDAFEWAKSGFNASLPTKVLIHGFGSDCSYIWAYEIRSALMAVEEVNTVCVDWTKGAELPNYVKASANTRLVGKQLSLLLSGLEEKNGLNLKTTHLIGFSLGAHIAGFAGADLGNLSRITGLDPAGPLFESQDPRARLDQTDADFVDVIHSNGENLILGGLGSSQPMGHVDFYPNGGRMQKGCSHLFVGAVTDIIWSSAVEGRSLCNHRRASKFFIDSISPRCHFPAFPCNSYDDFLEGECFPCTQERKCGNMGYYADKSKGRGQLFLSTREEEPFCAHQYLVKLDTDPGPIPIKSYGKIHITLIGDSYLNETFMMTKKEDEELHLGQPVSRILVPHPILSQPVKIAITYTAYSGWLSSGLSQWKVDKVSLMDSFGKISSICKKNLILESGVPATVPLYPGECDPPKDKPKIHPQDRTDLMPNFTLIKETFIPTQVVRVGLNDNSKESNEISKDEKENTVDSDAESSRAFNTRIIKADSTNQHLADSDGLIREIVEPILKPHSHATKNARAHNPDKEKPEISEPILGPTTSKSTTHKTSEPENDKDEIIKYESTNWEVPSVKPVTEKLKRQDESKAMRGFETTTKRNDPIEAIVTTVQFLPQRLARMFEQAEKYARDTLLPFVSTYTPRFLTDIIRPREPPRYVPLHYEEHEESDNRQEKKINLESSRKQLKVEFDEKKESENELKVAETRNFKQQDFVPPTKEPLMDETYETTPYTHIQRITKKPASSVISEKSDNIQYIVAEPLQNPNEEDLTSTKKPKSTSTTIEPQRNRIETSTSEATQSSSTSTSTSSTLLSVSKTLPTSTPKSIPSTTKTQKQKSYNISVEWGSNNPLDTNSDPKTNRQNISIEIMPKNTTASNTTRSDNNNFRPIEAIVNAFNVLPNGLTNFFNRAENYARKNLWPLIDGYVDEFLSNRQAPTTPVSILTNTNGLLIRDPILFETTKTETATKRVTTHNEGEKTSAIMRVLPKTTDSSVIDVKYKAVTHFPVYVKPTVTEEPTQDVTTTDNSNIVLVEKMSYGFNTTNVTKHSEPNINDSVSKTMNTHNVNSVKVINLKNEKSKNGSTKTVIKTSYKSSKMENNFDTIFFEESGDPFDSEEEEYTKNTFKTSTSTETNIPKENPVFIHDTTELVSTSTKKTTNISSNSSTDKYTISTRNSSVNSTTEMSFSTPEIVAIQMSSTSPKTTTEVYSVENNTTKSSTSNGTITDSKFRNSLVNSTTETPKTTTKVYSVENNTTKSSTSNGTITDSKFRNLSVNFTTEMSFTTSEIVAIQMSSTSPKTTTKIYSEQNNTTKSSTSNGTITDLNLSTTEKKIITSAETTANPLVVEVSNVAKSTNTVFDTTPKIIITPPIIEKMFTTLRIIEKTTEKTTLNFATNSSKTTSNVTSLPSDDNSSTTTTNPTTTTSTTTTTPKTIHLIDVLSTTKKLAVSSMTEEISTTTHTATNSSKTTSYMTSSTTTTNPTTTTSTTTTTPKTIRLIDVLAISPMTEEISTTTHTPESSTISRLTNIIPSTEIPRDTTRATRSTTSTTAIPIIKIPKYHVKKPYMHVQRIPKKGEKIPYKLIKLSDIKIDPKMLETTTTTRIETSTKLITTSTEKPVTVKKTTEFVSYVQKIPKKGKRIFYDIPKYIPVDSEVESNLLRKRQV